MGFTSAEEEDRRKLVLTSISSIIGGGVARLFCHPIDTMKAKIQVETSRLSSKDLVSNLMWRTIKETYQNEGLAGLYRGIGIATLGSAPALALFFTSYEYAKIQFRKSNALQNNENLKNFLCGLFAETVSCVLWVPIDVIKERLQVQSNLKSFQYKNAVDAIFQISKVEGLRGLYRAYGATILSFGPFSGLYLMSYEFLKKEFIKPGSHVGLFESTFMAGMAGCFASVLTNPLDIAKLRMQVQRAEGFKSGSGEPGRFGYKNVFHGVYTIAQKEGVLSLFKGSLARTFYHTPATAISLGLLEYIRHTVQKVVYH